MGNGGTICSVEEEVLNEAHKCKVIVLNGEEGLKCELLRARTLLRKVLSGRKVAVAFRLLTNDRDMNSECERIQH